ncbi:MAG: recombinase family protein [Oxalobacteraceae bacterium]|nr:recombinase family protein [Oxalobacteraceae bacterium]
MHLDLSRLVGPSSLPRQNKCPARGIYSGGEKRSPCGLRVENSKGLACKPNRGLRDVGESHPLRLCERLGYTIVQEYRDSGISGAKSRNDRPALDTLKKDTTRRRFDMVMCWDIDRLGRSILIHAPKS